MTTTFELSNNTSSEITIVHEPECFEFQLPVNEHIIIETNSCAESIVLNIWELKGEVGISILDHKSPYNVYHKGENVFEKYMD